MKNFAILHTLAFAATLFFGSELIADGCAVTVSGLSAPKGSTVSIPENGKIVITQNTQEAADPTIMVGGKRYCYTTTITGTCTKGKITQSKPVRTKVSEFFAGTRFGACPWDK